jgi:hypothetical protein
MMDLIYWAILRWKIARVSICYLAGETVSWSDEKRGDALARESSRNTKRKNSELHLSTSWKEWNRFMDKMPLQLNYSYWATLPSLSICSDPNLIPIRD